MSAFPAPSSNVPVFNPSLFTSLVSNVVSTSSAPTGTYVDYPNPQGPITFVSGTNATTIGANNLAIISDVGVGDLGIIFGANGLVYNGTTGPLGITWSNLATKIEAIQSLSQASNASTLNVNNTLRVQDGETDSLPTSYIDISSGVTNAIVSTTDLLLEAPNIDISGQATFQLPPHIPDPILGNDAAPKGYVDSLVGQYSGGFNLFFNYSQTDASYSAYKSLSQLVSASAGEIVPTTINTGNNLIAQFITEPLGIDTIPIGLWDAFVYGAINAIGGDAHYYFELWKKTALNVDSLLGTSGISPDINASPNNNPTSYSMVLTISTAIPLELTDRLYVVLYVNYNGSSSKDLSTYFEGSYYSFLQTSLNAGTTLLSSNNTWTGTNNFLLPPTTPTQVGTPANTDIVNYETITTLIGNIPAPTTPDLNAVLTEGSTATDLSITLDSSTIPANITTLINGGLSFTNGITTIQNTLYGFSSANVSTGEVYSLASNGLIIAGASGQQNIFNGDGGFIQIQDPSGKYLALSPDYININGNSGSVGQVITKDASNNPTWSTPEPIVSTLDYYITTDNPFFQYPPAPPTNALLQAYQYYGWYFINSVALRKIDWYFAPDYAMIVSDVKGLYMNYLNVTTTSNDNLPFITIYTKPTGSGDIIPGFAHSTCTYIANFTPTAATPFCSFMNISGTQPDPFPYGHQLGAMILSPVAPNPRGQYLPTEEILAISVGTNSTSPVNQVNFIMSKVGICLEQGNQELILNPQNIIAPAWSGTATSNLNMSSFSIDASANNLSIGTLTSTGLILGKSGTTTNIQGNLQIAGQPGASGQVLTSNGAGSVPTWTTSTSGWVGTATSNLNMSNYIITAPSSLNIGESTKSVVINGAVNTPNALNYGSGANVVVAYGGETNDVYDTTTTNNIQTRINATGGLIEQVYNAIISPSASGTGALILPLVKTRYSVYIINGSAYNWTISSQTGEFIIGGLAGTGIPSTSSITIKPSQTLGFVQVDGGILGKFNIFMSEVLQGTSPSFSGATCPTIDTSSTLSLGASTATGVNLGRTGQTTDLLGNVRVNNSSGSSGQVLTSTGASTAPTWQTPASGWVGTAASQLNMGIYDISGAVLDNSGGTLSVGANTTTTTIGKATTGITDLQGVVKINNSAGTSGQVLTSTGASTAPTWQTPAAGSASLAVVKTNPSLQTVAFAAGAFKAAYNNNFLNVTVPTLTATYLIKAQLLCNNNVANTAFFGNLGYRVGGGAQTSTAISLFNNLAMSNAANSSFSQQNSLTQCNLSVDNTYNQLSFTYIHTPATTGLVSYAFWLGSSIGNGAGTIFSMEIIQLIA